VSKELKDMVAQG